jgi:TPR repeat protein
MKVIFSALVFFIMITNQASSQDLNSGISAFQRGDFQAALNIFLPLADIDLDYTQLRISENSSIINPLAQYYLGLMYCHGKGVTRDKKKAFYWFDKSRMGGNSLAETATCTY